MNNNFNYQQRYQKLEKYIDNLKNEVKDKKEPEFSEKVLNLSWLIWEKLEEIIKQKGFILSVPNACPGLNNNFMYTWSNTDHYLECEIFGTGEVEFFYVKYMDKKHEKVWGEDTSFDKLDSLSNDVLEKLLFFTI